MFRRLFGFRIIVGLVMLMLGVSDEYRGGQNLRVMVFGKASKDTEAGLLPTRQAWVEMDQFNEELVKAGIVLDGGGLKPEEVSEIVSQAK